MSKTNDIVRRCKKKNYLYKIWYVSFTDEKSLFRKLYYVSKRKFRSFGPSSLDILLYVSIY